MLRFFYRPLLRSEEIRKPRVFQIKSAIPQRDISLNKACFYPEYSLEKTLMLGKTEGRRRKRATEDEMVGWNHRLNGYESEKTREDSGG